MAYEKSIELSGLAHWFPVSFSDYYYESACNELTTWRLFFQPESEDDFIEKWTQLHLMGGLEMSQGAYFQSSVGELTL